VESYHYQSATMLATVLLTQRGTPNIYQGDEIGMTNCSFDAIEEYDDIQVKNAYQSLVASGKYPERLFLQTANCIARDHARTPMQWSEAVNAGFSLIPAGSAGQVSSKPWLKVNPSYTRINVESQEQDPKSVLNYYKKLLHWRKQTPAMHYGSCQDLLPLHPSVWIYERLLEKDRFVIVANFSGEEVEAPKLLSEYNILLSNYSQHISGLLQPYEARICKH
jgi:oligo-1,6-glucosidase